MWPFKTSDDPSVAHLTNHFGAKPTKVFPGKDGVSVGFFSADSTGRPAGTLSTMGMSAKPMTMDSRAVDSDTKRAELVCYSDPQDTALDDLVRWMLYAAKFPFIQDKPTFLGWGHTVRMGKLFEGSPLTTLITFEPIVRPDKGTIFTRDGDDVSFLWLTFLTDAEYELKKSKGENAILDMFQENDHPLEFTPQRKSYV